MAGAIALAVPPLVFGPWLPFLDLVAFVGLDALPAQHSFGPLHYGVFQFTYIVHYALSRAMLALGFSAPAHIVLFYFLQGGVFFWVIWRLLPRLVPEPWLAGMATAVGALVFWDGFLLWGGPLPFSLGGTAVAAALLVTLREAEAPEKADRLLVPLLMGVAVMSHPFALTFVLILTAVRGVMMPARRWQSVALGVGLLLLGWVIRQDSPESGAAAAVTSLFTWPLAHVPQRLIELFLFSEGFAAQLFGSCPAGLKIYFWLLGAVHLLGFLASPVVAVIARDHRPMRLIAVLTCVVALLNLCSVKNDAVIPGWPWRILTFHNALLYLSGLACPLYLIRRWRPAWLRWTVSPPRFAWSLPLGAARALLLMQIPLLRLGDTIGRDYERTRASLLRSGVSNAFVVVTDIDGIKPFYLRCVPFLLFSDPQIVARNLLLYTEWHIQNRHPTRLTETWFDLGRPAYQASFFIGPEGIDVKVVPQPAGQIPLAVGNNQGEHGASRTSRCCSFIRRTISFRRAACATRSCGTKPRCVSRRASPRRTTIWAPPCFPPAGCRKPTRDSTPRCRSNPPMPTLAPTWGSSCCAKAKSPRPGSSSSLPWACSQITRRPSPASSRRPPRERTANFRTAGVFRG